MDPNQMRHEAAVATGTLYHDGNTAGGRQLAERLVAASNDAELSYGENAFAAAWFLSTLLGSLPLEQQAVLLTSVGNLAIEMHRANTIPALASVPAAGQA